MSTPSTAPRRTRVGLVGLQGYAATILDLLRAEDNHPDGQTTLAGVFAPDANNHHETIKELAAHGVDSFESYDALLASDIDAVWLPVPIHLHRPMAEQALSVGKTVMLEKPVAGCIDEHDRLADFASEHDGRVLIGFQDIYRPATAMLKRRLASGEFGQPLRAAAWGVWPRPHRYYQRNTWAGALARDGHWVLDSPLNNAMAHFANLAFFLLGPKPDDAAQLRSVEAALWRARSSIENFDTCSIRAELLEPDIPVTILLSHAAAEPLQPYIVVETDRGLLRIDCFGAVDFTPAGGATTELDVSFAVDDRPVMARALGAAAAERDADVHLATLANTRSHTLLTSAVSQAAPVMDVPESALSFVDRPNGRLLNVAGLSEAIDDAARSFAMIDHESIGLPTRVGRLDDLTSYTHFAGPAELEREVAGVG